MAVRMSILIFDVGMWKMPVIWRNILSPSSGQMEAVRSSEMMVSTYKSTWHYNLEDNINKVENAASSKQTTPVFTVPQQTVFN
jgi:hypothetical protein